MKYKTRTITDDGLPDISVLGGSVDSSIFIAYLDNGDPMIAVDVEYTVNKLENLSGDYFTIGTMLAARLPAFTGDLTKEEGSDLCSRKLLPGVAGNYSKVSVTIKGTVLSGGSLVGSDVPSLSWNKITSGKPTTLFGYGVSDGLIITGGEFIGPLRVSSCVSSTDLVTKQIVDAAIPVNQLPAGAMVIKTKKTHAPSFLTCNGADVLKSDYSALYEAIGDAFSVMYSPCYGTPWLTQLDFNTSSLMVGAWRSSGTLPGRINLGNVLVTKNRVYLLGGYNNNTLSSKVYTATISTNDTLSTWTTATALPIALSSFSIVVNRNRVYLVGGIGSNGVVSTIYCSTLSDTGVLGAWVLVGNLPSPRAELTALISRGKLTVIGGQNGGAAVLTVIQADIKLDNTLDTWISLPSLPSARFANGEFVTSSYVYLVGGYNGSSVLSSTIRAPINIDGTLGDWTSSVTIPAALKDMMMVSTGSRVHLIGGTTTTTASNKVYSAPINADDSIGSWVTHSSNLVASVSGGQVFITNKRIYLVGGRSGASRLNNIRYCSFTGGLSDYMPYMLSSYLVTSSDRFRLPDILDPIPDTGYYIKT